LIAAHLQSRAQEQERALTKQRERESPIVRGKIREKSSIVRGKIRERERERGHDKNGKKDNKKKTQAQGTFAACAA